jgi:hypothetical protein
MARHQSIAKFDTRTDLNNRRMNGDFGVVKNNHIPCQPQSMECVNNTSKQQVFELGIKYTTAKHQGSRGGEVQNCFKGDIQPIPQGQSKRTL